MVNKVLSFLFVVFNSTEYIFHFSDDTGKGDLSAAWLSKSSNIHDNLHNRTGGTCLCLKLPLYCVCEQARLKIFCVPMC